MRVCSRLANPWELSTVMMYTYNRYCRLRLLTRQLELAALGTVYS